MINLDGYEFKYCCASGALGFDGRGYWWERPFINPNLFTVITKTLTFQQRDGNYRWWKFWKTFRINSEYTINALGLPNPGYVTWIHSIYPTIQHLNIIPSICPFSKDEAKLMVLALNELEKSQLYPSRCRAIELNISCPNTESFDPVGIIETALDCSILPIIVKVGINDDYLGLCKLFGNNIIIDAINTVPWNRLKESRSPLYPLEGGFSDAGTGMFARLVLTEIKKYHPQVKVISGNGIFSHKEAQIRFYLGADAISFGTVFILTPWRPGQIIRKLEDGLPLTAT